MENNQQNELTSLPLELSSDKPTTQKAAEPVTADTEAAVRKPLKRQETPDRNRTLGTGEWMITLLLFLLPLVNIILMAVFAFSANGNIHRRNFARACLLWLILLLLGYAVAMTVAGYTIFDVFTGAF